jgi:hypothetical protein
MNVFGTEIAVIKARLEEHADDIASTRAALAMTKKNKK